MINVTTKRCRCGKGYCIYNEPNEKKGLYCGQCKTETMVNVANTKCRCGKGSRIYNEPGEKKGICCGQCKTETMVNVANKRCRCGKGYCIYNEPGQTVGVCCSKCKTETMTNVVSKRCKGQDGLCPQFGNQKYRGYCTHCFSNIFQKDPLVFQIRSKSKENTVRDYINTYFTGFIHDKPLYTGHCDCSIRRRLDHRILVGNTLLVVETDENQHKSYDEMDEDVRYDDLFQAFSGKWIYIRFNPDKFRSALGDSNNPELSSRLPNLKKEIDKQLNRVRHDDNTELLERVYMYYDGCDPISGLTPH